MVRGSILLLDEQPEHQHDMWCCPDMWMANEFLTPTSLYPHCLDIPFLAVSVEILGESDLLRGKKGLGRS